MNFMFEWQEQYLTSECSEQVGYCSRHENVKFISIPFTIVFCLAMLLEMSFQSIFATTLTSCWTIRVFTKTPGSATSVAGEL